MGNVVSIMHNLHGRSKPFLEELAEVEGKIMVAVADHDDVLRDRDIDAIAQASTLASELFTFAYDMAFGLLADSAAAQRHVQEMLAGLSALADKVFPSGDGDEAWDCA
jgi:hypothetical protein